MNTKSMLGIGFLVCISGIAAESQTSKRGGINTRESIMAQMVPDEYREFNAHREADPKTSADAALKLLRATRLKLRAERARPDYDYDAVNAHAAAWRLCLQMRGAGKDDYVKKAFLDEWNANLREENAEIPIQFASTIFPGAWQQDLFSDEFWNLAQRTNKKRTLSAICWLLYTHYPAADIAQLQRRMDSVDKLLRNYILAAIGWIKYNADRSKGPGPATEPPTLEID